MTAKKTKTRNAKTNTRNAKSPRDKARETAQRLLNQKFESFGLENDPNGEVLMGMALDALLDDTSDCVTHNYDKNLPGMFSAAVRLQDNAIGFLHIVTNILRNTDQKTRDLAIAEAFGPAK
jgi:hypothetical protein